MSATRNISPLNISPGCSTSNQTHNQLPFTYQEIEADPDLEGKVLNAISTLQATTENSNYLSLKKFHGLLTEILQGKPWAEIHDRERKINVLTYFNNVFKAANTSLTNPNNENLKQFHSAIMEDNLPFVTSGIAITPYQPLFKNLEKCIRHLQHRILYDNALKELSTLTLTNGDINAPIQRFGQDVAKAVEAARTSFSSRISLSDLTDTLNVAINTVKEPSRHYEACFNQANKVNKLSLGQIGRVMAGCLMILGGAALIMASAFMPFNFYGIHVAHNTISSGIGLISGITLQIAGAFKFFHHTNKDMVQINPVAKSMEALGQAAKLSVR